MASAGLRDDDGCIHATSRKALKTRRLQKQTSSMHAIPSRRSNGVVLGHFIPDATGTEETPPVGFAYGRAQELAADRKGMEMVLQAGFSYRQALRLGRRLIDLGWEYSSFEGLVLVHPSWKERLVTAQKPGASYERKQSATRRVADSHVSFEDALLKPFCCLSCSVGRL